MLLCLYWFCMFFNQNFSDILQLQTFVLFPLSVDSYRVSKWRDKIHFPEFLQGRQLWETTFVTGCFPVQQALLKICLAERICSQEDQILFFTCRPLFRRETKTTLTSYLRRKCVQSPNSLVLYTHYHSMSKFSRRQIDSIFLIFPRKQDLTFHAHCLHWRLLAWNVTLFSRKKIFQNVVCWKFYWTCSLF